MRNLTIGHAALNGMPDLAEASKTPSHMRIEQWLEGAIKRGRLKPGDRLPAEVEIAAALGVSRMTLRQALSTLAEKGLLDRRRGRFGGNFVASPRIDFDLTGLPGFTEQMRRAHVEAGARIIRATTKRAGTEIVRALRLRRGAQVHEIIRVRLANREPLAVEETYFPAAVFDDLLSHKLSGSLYEVMQREYDQPPYSASEVLEPVNANAKHAQLLGVEEGVPLMLVTRTSYTEAGLPVEHSYDYFRSDRTRITLHTQVDKETYAEIRPDTS